LLTAQMPGACVRSAGFRNDPTQFAIIVGAGDGPGEDSGNKMGSVMKFSNVRLLTGDFDASYRFWRDVMGLTVAFGPDSPGGVPTYAYLTIGDVGIELMRPEDFAGALGTPTPAAVPSSLEAVLVFGVDDVDATYAELVGKGARSLANPVDRPLWGARTAHIADPDGHLIEIYTRLAPSETPTA
jgi:lactoylglutathione lyase